MTSSPPPIPDSLSQNSIHKCQGDLILPAQEMSDSGSETDARLLVVDDSLTVRMSLRDVFVKQGYRVVLARGGEEAIEILRSEDIDVLILDLIMPHKNGMEVLREIKADESLSSIPILLLTAVADRKELVSCLDLGADDFVVKPWDERELLGRVRSMVRLRRFQAALLESEEKFRSISAAAQDAIIMMDQNGEVVYWNPAAETIFGYAPQEVQGKSVHNVLAPKRFHDAYFAGIRRFQTSGQGAAVGKTLELSALRKSGEEFPVEISLSAVQSNGKWHAVGIVRDISERKRAENERARLQQQLVASSRSAGMAEVATNVLHNVGNVLNSVNVSANLVVEKLITSRMTRLTKVCELMDEHADHLGEFISTDERGRHLPAYLNELARQLVRERDSLLDELQSLTRNVDHIKEIVSMQQAYAGHCGVIEDVDVADVVDNALAVSDAGLLRHGVELRKEYQPTPVISADRHKILQILVNLISNAKYAASRSPREDKQVTVRVGPQGQEHVRIEVQDNGVGIAPEHLTRVFEHGFTTKKDGHGFGLHSSALAAKDLGGSLAVRSDGLGRGATFTLTLPRTPCECDEDREVDGLPLVGQDASDTARRIIDVQV